MLQEQYNRIRQVAPSAGHVGDNLDTIAHKTEVRRDSDRLLSPTPSVRLRMVHIN